VDEQRDMLATSKSKIEAQHVALLAVGAARTAREAARAALTLRGCRQATRRGAGAGR
jgi:hypothetical protein